MNIQIERNDILILKDMVDSAIKEEAERLIEKAKKELEERTPEIIAGVIVDVSSIAEFQNRSNNIVFTIKKS